MTIMSPPLLSPRNGLRLILSMFFGMMAGVFIGISLSSSGLFVSRRAPPPLVDCNCKTINTTVSTHAVSSAPAVNLSISKPAGTETLPSGIIVSQTDLFLRRLWGNPEEDLAFKPKYLLTLTVGLNQLEMVDKTVAKFDKDWLIVLFHYDGQTDAWDRFEWSQRAVHVSVRKQTKWWYAKRFLHPDVVALFEYLFIWDEDLDVEHFDAQKYIELVKKHGLEISQPGLEPDRGLTWQMTKRRGDIEVHKETEERPGWCTSGPHKPPCAGFVEIMAPVFSRKAWRCVWHMIQNDLVHGWGLDFGLQKCAEPAHEKIGVVDAQWIRHRGVPSLGSQGQAEEGKQPWQGVRERCNKEWRMFADRMKKAEQVENATLHHLLHVKPSRHVGMTD